MNLKKAVEDQMASSTCFLRNPLPWIALLVPFLICNGFSGYGVLSVLITSLVLVLSTILFAFSKQKPISVETSAQDEAFSYEGVCSTQAQVEEVVSKPETQSESIAEKKEAQESKVCQVRESLVTSPDLYSESESIAQSFSSEDSEVDWPYYGNADQSPDCSDDSISDEESLIEIALPSGYYVGPKEEDPKFNLQKKLPDFSPETIFAQHSLMGLLTEINEMNEEENLIEIDISMGSIKCSRFEIEA